MRCRVMVTYQFHNLIMKVQFLPSQDRKIAKKYRYVEIGKQTEFRPQYYLFVGSNPTTDKF